MYVGDCKVGDRDGLREEGGDIFVKDVFLVWKFASRG